MAADSGDNTNGKSNDSSNSASHSGSDTHTESRADIESRLGPLHRSPLRALIQDFSPLWFTWCMNSGQLSILMHQCPYQFSGLLIIADIFFVFDFVLFILFSIIMTLRFVMFGKRAYGEVTGSVSELALMGCWPISWMTLTALVGMVVSNSYWGGFSFSIVAYVMWWISVAWCVGVLSWVFVTIIKKHGTTYKELPTMIIIPAVSVSTSALVGGLVVGLGYDVNPRLSVPVIIVGFMLVGIGILLGFMLSTYLIHGFFAIGWPAPPQTTSVFILVGPMGQSAAALQILGASASKYGKFAGYDKGTFLTAQAAPALDAACVLIALMLTGLGIIWTIFAVFVMVQRAVERKLTWTPGWNAIIFPTGTLATAFSLFSVSMASNTFGVLNAAMIIILTGVFLLNMGYTAVRVSQGKLLIVREDPRVKKEIEEQQKEK